MNGSTTEAFALLLLVLGSAVLRGVGNVAGAIAVTASFAAWQSAALMALPGYLWFTLALTAATAVVLLVEDTASRLAGPGRQGITVARRTLLEGGTLLALVAATELVVAAGGISDDRLVRAARDQFLVATGVSSGVLFICVALIARANGTLASKLRVHCGFAEAARFSVRDVRERFTVLLALAGTAACITAFVVVHGQRVIGSTQALALAGIPILFTGEDGGNARTAVVAALVAFAVAFALNLGDSLDDPGVMLALVIAAFAVRTARRYWRRHT